MHLLTWIVGIYLFLVYIKLGSFCIWLHCGILMILRQGAFMGDALKPGKIMMFLHQGKFNKISETQIIILVIENKKNTCSSMQFHGIPWNLECANFDDTSSSVEFHGIPWNSRIEWKTVNLIFFLGCQSWHCFGLSGKSSWFFNIQEVWFMQIVIFDVLLMRPCVNTLP